MTPEERATLIMNDPEMQRGIGDKHLALLVERIDAAIREAVEEERTACAKVAEDVDQKPPGLVCGDGSCYKGHGVAVAIRSRGNQ